MYQWVQLLMGDYSYQAIILISIELQFAVATMGFCLHLHPRRLVILRAAGGMLLGFGLLMAAAVIRTEHKELLPRIIVNLLQYLFLLPLLLLCFDEDISLLLKVWCSGIAVKEIGGGFFPVLQFMLGYNSHETQQLLPLDPVQYGDLHWIVYYLLHFLIYLLMWRLFHRRSGEGTEGPERRRTVILSLTALLLLGVLGAITDHYRDESAVLYLCTRLFMLTVSVFILLLYAGLEFRSRSRADMAMMDQLLREERKQYLQMKENIDIINMHCHDLKHQLSDFSDRLTDREISELQEAMEIYDSNIKTGCDALDVVLYIHQLTCRQEGILLTCLAEGEALSFMRTRHIYALFNNAIGNALEAVRKVTDPEKRVIGVSVAREGSSLEIEVTNYTNGEKPSGGTTKADKAHHGFGTRSMKYIAEQYKGQLTTEIQKGIYTLHISLPLPAQP